MKQKGESAPGRVLFKAALCFLVLTGLYLLLLQKAEEIPHTDDRAGERIIALNEIKKLTELGGGSPAAEQIDRLAEDIAGQEDTEHGPAGKYMTIMYLFCLLFLTVLVSYFYVRIIKPFHRLENYAAEIAKGNFEQTLSYERQNMFGAFTWAFDHMRREIQKARLCEKEAIENNKTVIATLSHDIKTPIASIRAYAEALEANMDSTPERRNRYLKVILRKCDEVTELTNDLFLHSLSDLDKLQTVEKEIAAETVIRRTIEEMEGDKRDIKVMHSIDTARIMADEKRLAQVLENIFNNARKYAPEKGMKLWTEIRADGMYDIHIKDDGDGILPEDMPFVFEKFYRGKNTADAPGAGLGLYICKYIMEQMKGEVKLDNSKDGLEVILSVPCLMNTEKH